MSGDRWRIDASGLRATFGKRVVLDHVDLQIVAGESTALIGPSGSGKTTLLSILGGLRRPDAGTVSVVGDGGYAEELSECVAWVLQTTNALGRRSVLQNVVIGTLCRAGLRSERETVALQALADVGLLQSARQRARSLSGGELQRLSIARAVAASRPFLFADEPTGQLDLESTRRVCDILFRSSDIGVVVATHDPEVWRRCDRVVDLGSRL